MRDQKTLKEVYRTELEKYWDSHMVNYLMKSFSYIVELNNGEILEIDKPDIKKDFCFGHGLYGVSTEEEYQGAAAMVKKAENDTNYFISKNMEPLNNWIRDLQDDSYQIYIRTHYIKQPEDCKLVAIEFKKPWDQIPEDYRLLTPEEINLIIEGYEEVKKAFTKRLNTYLKRYGLTKVNAWTYLVD